MSRYAKKNVAIEDLEKKVYECAAKSNGGDEPENLEDCIYLILGQSGGDGNSRILKDLEKIEFDYENAGIATEYELADFEMLGDFPVLWCFAGGDWECPVVFCLYIDEKDVLRAYVPSNGNLFNHGLKSAYGNNDDDIDLDEYGGDGNYWNLEKMEEDAKNRIVVR